MSSFEKLNSKIFEQLVRVNQAYLSGKEQLREVQCKIKHRNLDNVPFKSPEGQYIKNRQDLALRLSFFLNGVETAIARFERDLNTEIEEHLEWQRTKRCEQDPYFILEEARLRAAEFIKEFEPVVLNADSPDNDTATHQHNLELAQLVNSKATFAQKFLDAIGDGTQHYITLENLGEDLNTPAGDRFHFYRDCAEADLTNIKQQLTEYAGKGRSLQDSSKMHLLKENEALLEEHLSALQYIKSYARCSNHNPQKQMTTQISEVIR